MTDGSTVIATRYATLGAEPASLYFSSGTRFECDENMEYRMRHSDKQDQAVLQSRVIIADSCR